MFVQGRDCTIAFKTAYREIDIPYSEETVRENVCLLEEYPSIEGDGRHKAVRKSGGVAGCVVSPLTIGTAPLLLRLAFGEIGLSAFVSGSQNLYKHGLDLLPSEDTEPFGIVQGRGGKQVTGNGERVTVNYGRKLYEDCRVVSFELRILRDEAIKLKLDIRSERPPAVYPYNDKFDSEMGERFRGENVEYRINGKVYKNIYGITFSVKKENGTKTEIWLRRVLESGADLPETIDELTVTARLVRDSYEGRNRGRFRITFGRLLLQSDETSVECADSVIAPLRYFVNGNVTGEVYAVL